ncbi:MAG: cytochrome c biogenesis protein ResB [Planctomycetota bacterium]|jgi:hypothetical protein
MMPAPLRALLRLFGSVKLAVVLLVILLILTYLGTVAQVDHGLWAAKRRYFESWLILEEIGGTPLLPLPGGYLTMLLLFINLICGGLLAMRWRWSKAGVIITHIGIVYLLFAGFVTHRFADEGGLNLYEGEESAEFISYHEWEVAIRHRTDEGMVGEQVIPHGVFVHDDHSVTCSGAEVPFTLTLADFIDNAVPERDGSGVDGWRLRPLERDTQDERNRAGLRATVTFADGSERVGLLWGDPTSAPFALTADGRDYIIELRRRRMDLPFVIKLEDFHHEFHPGTGMPREFRSDVVVSSIIDGERIDQAVRIEMNQPLRRGPYVAFQASYGPQGRTLGPNEPMFSGFAIVRNPADQWPLYATIVIAIGLCWHFGAMLLRYVRREVSAR